MAKIIIVLGCHRSGTSMIAGVLSKMGVFMGDDLIMDTMPENPKGYYEDREAVAINAELLEAANGGWEDLPTTEEILEAADRCPEFGQRMTDFIGKRSEAHHIWGWKDPRTMATFPAWMPHLEGHGVQLVTIQRKFSTVCESIFVREKGDMPRQDVEDLVQSYVERLDIIEQQTRYPCHSLQYEDVLLSPYSYVLGLSTAINFRPRWGGISMAAQHIDLSLNRTPGLIKEGMA
jgi:hypothetical protein